MVTTCACHSANKVMAHHNGDEYNAGNPDGGIKEMTASTMMAMKAAWVMMWMKSTMDISLS